MRVSVPGVPGVYYDTDTKSTALTTAFSVVGRRVPKPQRYALQALPLLWSLDVDLQEVPDDHPFQYLHPEGARSIEELTRDRIPGPNVGREFERTLQFAVAVNRETERGIDQVLGRSDDAKTAEPAEGTVIEITDLNDESEPADDDLSVGEGRIGEGPAVDEDPFDDDPAVDEDSFDEDPDLEDIP